MIVYPCLPRYAVFQNLHLPQRKKSYEETHWNRFSGSWAIAFHPNLLVPDLIKPNIYPSWNYHLCTWNSMIGRLNCFLVRALNGLCSVHLLLLVSPRPLEVRRSQHLRHFGPGWNSRDWSVLRGVGVVFFDYIYIYISCYDVMMLLVVLVNLLYVLLYNDYHYLWLCYVVIYTCYLLFYIIR